MGPVNDWCRQPPPSPSPPLSRSREETLAKLEFNIRVGSAYAPLKILPPKTSYPRCFSNMYATQQMAIAMNEEHSPKLSIFVIIKIHLPSPFVLCLYYCSSLVDRPIFGTPTYVAYFLCLLNASAQ